MTLQGRFEIRASSAAADHDQCTKLPYSETGVLTSRQSQSSLTPLTFTNQQGKGRSLGTALQPDSKRRAFCNVRGLDEIIEGRELPLLRVTDDRGELWPSTGESGLTLSGWLRRSAGSPAVLIVLAKPGPACSPSSPDLYSLLRREGFVPLLARRLMPHVRLYPRSS